MGRSPKKMAAGMAPFAASIAKTMEPYFQPKARATLLAPGLPDPNVVMSTPLARATTMALGMVPMKYDTIAARTTMTGLMS